MLVCTSWCGSGLRKDFANESTEESFSISSTFTNSMVQQSVTWRHKTSCFRQCLNPSLSESTPPERFYAGKGCILPAGPQQWTRPPTPSRLTTLPGFGLSQNQCLNSRQEFLHNFSYLTTHLGTPIISRRRNAGDWKCIIWHRCSISCTTPGLYDNSYLCPEKQRGVFCLLVLLQCIN